jgi:hypothetical protein
MTTPPVVRSDFTILRGVVSNLTIVDGEHEFFQTTSTKMIGGGAGAALALSGLPGAATAASRSVVDSADDLQTFACQINGLRVTGMFSKVTFGNGDEVEAVGRVHPGNSFVAFAVRRRSDKTLWMSPHCIRGSRTHWRRALKLVPIIWSALMLATVFWMWLSEWLLDKSLSVFGTSFLFSVSSLLALVVSFYFPLKSAYRSKPFVNLAERIFSSLGYVDPTRVDMERQDRLYWKTVARADEQRQFLRWVYRYVDDR